MIRVYSSSSRSIDVLQSYAFTSREVAAIMVSSLNEGEDPDRMKGALYLLSGKNTSELSLSL